MSCSNSDAKVIVLMSSDKERFEVEENVLSESLTIKCMREDIVDNAILLPNVTSKVLAKVIEFCTHHHTDSAFAENFVKVNHGILFEIISAANYLDIKSLLDLTIEYVANFMKGNTPEEIRKTFRIKNDYTPDEEVRQENAWAFPGFDGRHRD